MPLRYVVLHHTGYGEDHYDLMFETEAGSKLATWRSPTWPPAGSALTPLADHRRDYLTYEGPVSKDRGEVRRVHAGTHSIRDNSAEALVVDLENGLRIMLPRR